ncbi:MAG TPA: hypothetical protein VIT38_10525 [Allosphingosinicella sp.]|jgi:uncharacterized lipoprotein
MMFARSLILPVLAAALLLAGCATTEERLARGADAEEANAELLANCELTGAAISSSGNNYHLALPPAVYATRDQAPTAGRIACISLWARERDLTLNIVEAR